MKYRDLIVEILDTGEHLVVQLKSGNAAVALRNYEKSEEVDAIRFASVVAEITQANWQSIRRLNVTKETAGSAVK